MAGVGFELNKLLAKARAFPGLANIDSDLKLNKPQLAVTVKRDKIADLGVDVQQGRGAIRAWADIRRGQLAGVTADVVLADVATRLDPAELIGASDHRACQFDRARRGAEGGQLGAHREQMLSRLRHEQRPVGRALRKVRRHGCRHRRKFRARFAGGTRG